MTLLVKRELNFNLVRFDYPHISILESKIIDQVDNARAHGRFGKLLDKKRRKGGR